MNENKFNEEKTCYCDMYGDYERRRCRFCADIKNNKGRKKPKSTKRTKKK